jgi:hypothetical protein
MVAQRGLYQSWGRHTTGRTLWETFPPEDRIGVGGSDGVDETRLDGRILERELVSSVERPASGIGLEEIGLELEEGKAMLRKVQARIVQTQVDVLSAAHRRCFRCGRNQRVKDLRTRTARTVFGTVEVPCRRYFRCKCRGGKKAAIWPLHRHQLSGTSPELQYLYATWGSKVPYRRAAAGSSSKPT